MDYIFLSGYPTFILGNTDSSPYRNRLCVLDETAPPTSQLTTDQFHNWFCGGAASEGSSDGGVVAIAKISTQIALTRHLLSSFKKLSLTLFPASAKPQRLGRYSHLQKKEIRAGINRADLEKLISGVVRREMVNLPSAPESPSLLPC